MSDGTPTGPPGGEIIICQADDGGSGLVDYFDELFARIREIRSGEARVHQRIREIFALAAAPIATDWSESCRVGILPLRTRAFPRRTSTKGYGRTSDHSRTHATFRA